MNISDLLQAQANDTEILLTHNCKTENGIESDEVFIIAKIKAGFEQVEIINQYKQRFLINTNQIKTS